MLEPEAFTSDLIKHKYRGLIQELAVELLTASHGHTRYTPPAHSMPIPAHKHTSPPVSQNAALDMSVRPGLVLVPGPGPAPRQPGVLSTDTP